MEKTSLIFSILFFLAFGINIFFGIYVIFRKSRSHLNMTFFAICISLSLWSLGFSFGITAPDFETCFFWRRISALGWGTMYSILLHFILIMTEKKSIIKKWWIYPLIYFPAAVIIYVFAISTDMALKQYNLVNTLWGWINITEKNVWDMFFDIYYASFSIIVMGLIWNWGRKSSDVKHKAQAKLIFYSFIVALLLGTLTDNIFNSYLAITLPQMAPIIILIPNTAIFISIKKYGFMNLMPVNKDEIILNVITRAKIYHYIAISLVAGSILNFISQYFVYRVIIKSVTYFSIFFLLIGFLIKIVQHLKLDDDIKDNIILIISCLLIPIITLRFIESASISVWAFPFIFIITFIVFNKRKMMIGLALSIFSTQIMVWVLAPLVEVHVDESDYIVRIGLFSIVLILAFYVNKIYILKLNENANQTKNQKLISAISSDFVTANLSNLDEKINNMLKKSGDFFQVDRVYILMFDLEHKTMTNTHIWCNAGIEPELGFILDTKANAFLWWRNQVAFYGKIHIPDVRKMPKEANDERQQLERQQVLSLIAIPIAGSGKVQGYLGYESVKLIRKWDDDHINILEITANILADSIMKVGSEKKQNYLAYYDQLTKLPNRMLFQDRANQAIQLAIRTEKIVGVIFLDIDSFKTVNDTLGHEAGDELLIIVSQELSRCVRKSDTVARFGGDEFLILINNISNAKDLFKVADNIMGLFNRIFCLKGQEFFITASAGIAVYPIDGEDVEALIKNSDVAMYNAKEKGKNQYVLCSTDMKNEVQRTMELSNLLYRALERNELVLYYQPQINIQSQKIVGFEALLRWKSSEYDIVPPHIFIPLAEKTGLINPIGEWVIRTACLQNKKWQNSGFPHARMAVNLSVYQFRNPKLVTLVENILKETELNPECLELEITESIVIKEPNYIVNILNNLKKLGVTISIDDFGTEYSSLSRLKLLPIDRIKMDMQFVHGIEGSEKDRAIAKIIINLAKSLGLEVIAEGVETVTQLEFLKQSMCDEVQGYYYYKPMPAEEIEKLMYEILAI